MSRAHRETPEDLCIAAEESRDAARDELDLETLLTRIPKREAIALRLREGLPGGQRRSLRMIALAMGLRDAEEAAALVAKARASVLAELAKEREIQDLGAIGPEKRSLR